MNIIGNHQLEDLKKTVERAGLMNSDSQETVLFSLNEKDLKTNLLSIDQLQKLSEQNKVYIWGDSRMNSEYSSEMDRMVNTVLNDNIHYIKTHSLIRLVEDVRLLEESDATKKIKQDRSDVLLIYNSYDKSNMEMVSQLLREVLKMKELCYDQDGKFDFHSELENSLPFCDMIVLVYFNESSWAGQFLPELWKLSGGGSSERPILVVSDKESADIRKDLLNVKLVNAPLPMIPLEIKMQFDKKK